MGQRIGIEEFGQRTVLTNLASPMSSNKKDSDQTEHECSKNRTKNLFALGQFARRYPPWPEIQESQADSSRNL